MKAERLNNTILQTYAQMKQPDGSVIIPTSWLPIIPLLIVALQFVKMFTNEEVDKIIDIIVEALRKFDVIGPAPEKK